MRTVGGLRQCFGILLILRCFWLLVGWITGRAFGPQRPVPLDYSQSCAWGNRLTHIITWKMVVPVDALRRRRVESCPIIGLTSCYRSGSDRPHRRGVTPLLRGIGCFRRTRIPEASVVQWKSGTCPHKVPVFVGGDPSSRLIKMVPWTHAMHSVDGLSRFAGSRSWLSSETPRHL